MLLLSFDEQLFHRTAGQIGDKFEKSVHEVGAVTDIWGVALDSEQFLLEQQQAITECFLLAKQYWGQGNLIFQDTDAAKEFVQDKLVQFFREPANEQRLFTWIHKNCALRLTQLLEFMLTKPVHSEPETLLEQIMVYQVGERFFVQPIFVEHGQYWYYVAAKKIYSLFLQQPLTAIEQPLQLMRMWKTLLHKNFSKNRIATMLYKLVW